VSRLVVDASAWVELLLRTPAGRRMEGELFGAPEVELHAPALCDVEVASTLRRAILGGRLTVERAGQALQDLGDLPLTRHGHLPLLAGALDLRDNFSVYDAVYVLLAERFGARLVTGDGRLARAVNTLTASGRLTVSVSLYAVS